jgi:hypothetical protein
MAKVRRRVAVEEKSSVVRAKAQVPPPPPPDALWSIAMLRIAMELKRPNAPGLDEIIGGVVERMRLPREQFERYLSENFSALQELAKNKGFNR